MVSTFFAKRRKKKKKSQKFPCIAPVLRLCALTANRLYCFVHRFDLSDSDDDDVNALPKMIETASQASARQTALDALNAPDSTVVEHSAVVVDLELSESNDDALDIIESTDDECDRVNDDGDTATAMHTTPLSTTRYIDLAVGSDDDEQRIAHIQQSSSTRSPSTPSASAIRAALMAPCDELEPSEFYGQVYVLDDSVDPPIQVKKVLAPKKKKWKMESGK